MRNVSFIKLRKRTSVLKKHTGIHLGAWDEKIHYYNKWYDDFLAAVASQIYCISVLTLLVSWKQIKPPVTQSKQTRTDKLQLAGLLEWK